VSRFDQYFVNYLDYKMFKEQVDHICHKYKIMNLGKQNP